MKSRFSNIALEASLGLHQKNTYLRLCNEWNIEGRLCKTTDEWINHLSKLTDKDLRRKEGEDLKQLAIKQDPSNMLLMNGSKF